MGIRMDQQFGLNEWAEAFVAGEQVLAYTERVVRVYPDGREETQPDRPVHESTVKTEDSGERYHGMYESEYSLRKFTFPDGRVFYERVQSDMWSSGPCFFLALQDENGQWVPESLWPDEEIEAA